MSGGCRVLAFGLLLGGLGGAAADPAMACAERELHAGRDRVRDYAGHGGTQTPTDSHGTDSRAREAYRQARERQAAGDGDGALALLWHASGLAPGNADIQMALAEALERVGALDASIEVWRAALAARPGDRKASRGFVLALVAVGRNPEAIAHARAAADAAPKDAEALFTLGLAESEHDVDAALAAFRSVLARAPDHTLTRYNLALLLNRMDRLDEAITELTRVIALDPKPEAHYALGIAWWHRGDAARATAAFEAAIALDPKHAGAFHKLGVVRAAERDWRGAAAALRRALALRPDVPEVHHAFARVLSASGDEAAARAEAAEGERLRLESEREHEARVWTSLGSGRLENGDALAALDAFRRALAIRDTYAPAHFQMGRALERLGDAEAAEGAYARARQLNPHLVRATSGPAAGLR
jgi:tetratricopeptide (TPR) repeat protein